MPKPHNIYTPRRSVVSPTGEGRAQQQFKKDCDINTIMAKFQKTGAVDHASQFGEEYGVVTSTTLHEAMNVVAHANSMFAELPSKLRTKFRNDPREFYDFVQDPKNHDEAHQLGLTLSPSAETAAAAAKEAASKGPKPGEGPPGEAPEAKTASTPE